MTFLPRDLGPRVLTGTVFIGTFVGALYVGGWILWAYALAVLLLVGWEYTRLADLPRSMGVLFLLALGSLFGLLTLGHLLGAWLFFQFALLAFALMFLPAWPEISSDKLGKAVFGLAYFGFPMAWFMEVARFSREHLLAFFVMLWAADIGAYVTGKLIGRRPLHEKISPGKTLEGFIGRLIWAVMAAAVLMQVMDWNIWTLLVGLGVGVFSEVGDLLESVWKRERGVKDSSNLLPGHGGFLDRLDSLFASLPVFWILWKTLLAA